MASEKIKLPVTDPPVEGFFLSDFIQLSGFENMETEATREVAASGPRAS